MPNFVAFFEFSFLPWDACSDRFSLAWPCQRPYKLGLLTKKRAQQLLDSSLNPPKLPSSNESHNYAAKHGALPFPEARSLDDSPAWIFANARVQLPPFSPDKQAAIRSKNERAKSNIFLKCFTDNGKQDDTLPLSNTRN